MPRSPRSTLRNFGIRSARNLKSSREFLILCTKMKTITKKAQQLTRRRPRYCLIFFSSVFTQEDIQDIPTPKKKTFKNWLKTINISKEKIKKKLLMLKISKSQGPDELHPRRLNVLAEEIAAPLETIFIQSLKEGKTSKKWKTGEISAIFKKGNRRHTGNYRPVSQDFVCYRNWIIPIAHWITCLSIPCGHPCEANPESWPQPDIVTSIDISNLFIIYVSYFSTHIAYLW